MGVIVAAVGKIESTVCRSEMSPHARIDRRTTRKTLGTKINVFEMNKLRKKTIKLYACNCRFVGNIGMSYTCELFSWICLIVSK